jgi:hypothetical protein
LIAWLGHPLTVLALVLLILNDHVFKAAYPGWLTGKLSDAAGLVLAPALLAALTSLLAPRLNPRGVALGALLTVAAAFTIIKSFAYGAQQASAVWSLIYPSQFRVDRTDLLTLPFLALAWWAWTAARRRPAPTRWVRAARVGVLLPIGLIGVAATTPAYEANAILVANVADGIYLVSSDDVRHGDTAVRSTDDGASWSVVDGPTADVLKRLPPAATQACSTAAPRTCYRIESGAIAVQRSTDGGATWADDWRLTDKQRRTLARAYRGIDDIDRDLVAKAIAVHEVPGGQVVIAANGRDGFAQRGVDGTWQRIGFPEYPGPYAADVPKLNAVDTERRYLDVSLAIAVTVLLAGLVVIVGAAWAGSRVGRPWWWFAVAGEVVGAPLVLAMAVGGREVLVLWPFLLIGGPLVVIVTAVLAVLATLTVRRAVPAWRGWAAQVWAAGLLTGALTATIWGAWLAGALPAIGTAVLLSAAAALPGLVVVALAGRSISYSASYSVSSTLGPDTVGR